jgi:hypothetical protein
MSVQSLQSTLTRIDENIQLTQQKVWDEVMDYLERNPQEAVRQLSTAKRVLVPTSYGERSVSLDELESLSR